MFANLSHLLPVTAKAADCGVTLLRGERGTEKWFVVLL